jgi:ribosomal protein S1
VIFDSGNYKAGFTTRNNLYRYERFRKFIPTETLRARVVEVKPDSVMVDMFGPMIEEYVIPRVKHPWLQCKLNDYQPITVKNLHLVRGGFVGQAVIPNITDWVGEDYVIDAFIPGSQIVQNTTDDFEQFEGADVEAFIMAYSPKPFNAGMSLVCSVKNLIKHRGNLRMMEIHKWWCDNEENWEKFSEERFEGIVTGIINSSQKCGVFVEVPALEITGMVNVSADSLSEYHPGDEVTVGISGFDEKMVYNEAVGQMQHTTPFEIIDGAIKEVNVKPILKLA